MSKTPSKGKSWVHTLYFNAFFEDALAKVRAETGLGESYAIFNALNEYWHEHGYISEEGYEHNRDRYSVGIVDEFKRNLARNPTTLEELKEQNRDRELEEHFSNILRNWDQVKAKPKSREYWIRRAQEHPELQVAKELLKRAGDPNDPSNNQTPYMHHKHP